MCTSALYVPFYFITCFCYFFYFNKMESTVLVVFLRIYGW